ncbi:hypothetical protein Tco_0583073 [Tanacetum coccineum]
MPHLQPYHYIADFNPEEDKEDPEEDPTDHLVDEGDNDDNESSDDDDDDDDVVKDTEAFETDESASTPTHLSTPYHLETMTTVNQGMSVEEIERVVAQRLANAIEAIAIYKTKTNKARKSMSQTNDKKNQETCDMIHRLGKASKPKTMQDAIEFVTKLIYKKISTPAERQAENKRKLDNTSKNNQNQQQPNKRQNTGRAYIAGTGKREALRHPKPVVF